jgi:hypothetical protein
MIDGPVGWPFSQQILARDDHRAFVKDSHMANEQKVEGAGFDLFVRVTPTGAPAAAAGPRCTITFGGETLPVDPTNKTVQQLFLENADTLGFDRNRAVAYPSGGRVIDPATPAAAGVTYQASISYEAKG